MSEATKLTKVLSIILIIDLILPLKSLIEVNFGSNPKNDSFATLVIFALAISIVNYFLTIRYCNRLKKQDTDRQNSNQYYGFLIMSIAVFICAALMFFLIVYGFIAQFVNGDAFFNLTSKKDYLIIAYVIIYSILGIVLFFGQLKLRKLLMSKRENTLEWLIDSVGSETKNSNEK